MFEGGGAGLKNKNTEDIDYIWSQVEKQNSLRSLSSEISWPKLWDMARDQGIPSSRSLTVTIKVLKKLKGTIEAKGTTLEAVLTAVSVLPDLESIAMTLESVETSTEECVESIQETHHPCGGSGWKKIADVDMAN